MKKILMCGVLILLFSFKHPFYLSVTDLKYSVKEKALQGSVKIFTNDLEDALKKIHNQSIDLINPKDSIKIRKILEEYLNKRLAFKVNNEPKSYACLGFENEQEATWIYVEIAKCALPKKVDVSNAILYDYLSGQSNIVHLEVKGQSKSYKVENPKREMSFNF